MYLFLCITTLFFVGTDGNGDNLRFYFRNNLSGCEDPGFDKIFQGKKEEHTGNPMVTEFKCFANTHLKDKEGGGLNATRLEHTIRVKHPYFKILGEWISHPPLRSNVEYFDEVPFGIFEIPIARNSAEAKHWMGKGTECYAKFIEKDYYKQHQHNVLIRDPFKPVHIIGQDGEEFINRFVLATRHENNQSNVYNFKYPKIDNRVKSFYEPPYTFIEPVRLSEPVFNSYPDAYLLQSSIGEVEKSYIDYNGLSSKYYATTFNSAVHPRTALVIRDAKNELFKFETEISIIGVSKYAYRVLNSIVDSFCFEKAGKKERVFKVKIKKPEEKEHLSYEIWIQGGEQKIVPKELTCVVKLQNEMCYVYEDLSNAKAYSKHQNEPSKGTVEVFEKEGLDCSHYIVGMDEHNVKHYVNHRGLLVNQNELELAGQLLYTTQISNYKPDAMRILLVIAVDEEKLANNFHNQPVIIADIKFRDPTKDEELLFTTPKQYRSLSRKKTNYNLVGEFKFHVDKSDADVKNAEELYAVVYEGKEIAVFNLQKEMLKLQKTNTNQPLTLNFDAAKFAKARSFGKKLKDFYSGVENIGKAIAPFPWLVAYSDKNSG